MTIDLDLVSLQQLTELRSRELKKLLQHQLNVSNSVLSKIIDRKELRELAWNLLQNRRNKAFYEFIFQIFLYGIPTTAILAAVIHYRKQLTQFFGNSLYTIYERLYTLRLAKKNSLWLCYVVIVLCILLDVVGSLLQMQTLLSWILPSELLRKYKIPTLSFPVGSTGPSSIASSFHESFNRLASSSSPSSSHSTSRSYSLDVGPMITVYVIGFVTKKLSDYCNRRILRCLNGSDDVPLRPVRGAQSDGRGDGRLKIE